MDYYPVDGYRPATMQCVLESAVKRNVPANVLLGIYEVEGGKQGMVKQNTNGSYDLGQWQVNTIHLDEFKRYGVDRNVAIYALKNDGCYSADYAAYRLQICLNDKRLKDRDFWERAACYHSRTPVHNAVYRTKLRPAAERWEKWLSTHYTVKVIQP